MIGFVAKLGGRWQLEMVSESQACGLVERSEYGGKGSRQRSVSLSDVRGSFQGVIEQPFVRACV